MNVHVGALPGENVMVNASICQVGGVESRFMPQLIEAFSYVESTELGGVIPPVSSKDRGIS